MKDRLKGILMLLPLLTGLYLGGPLLYFTAFILSVLGLHELYNTFKEHNIKPISFVGLAFSFSLFIKNLFNLPIYITTIILFSLFIITALLTINKNFNIVDFSITYFGIMYITIPFEAIIAIYESSTHGFKLALLVFVISFSTDIFAYLIGKKFGKRKLIPKVSPNKTVEGSLGAIFCTILITTIYCLLIGLNPVIFIPVAIIGSIFAQIGDLFASSIKRYNEVKDFGALIPGHGGIIDRFDSILFTAPLILILFLH